jgi:hypothetical protein
MCDMADGSSFWYVPITSESPSLLALLKARRPERFTDRAVVEHDIADGLADRFEAARQRAFAQVPGIVTRLPQTAPRLVDQEWRLIRGKAWSSRSPPSPAIRCFVFFAFPWGEAGTELSAATAPLEWQHALLDELGRRLREGSEIGHLFRSSWRASGHAEERWGGRLRMMAGMMTLGFLLVDDKVALAEIDWLPALRKRRLLGTFWCTGRRRQGSMTAIRLAFPTAGLPRPRKSTWTIHG